MDSCPYCEKNYPSREEALQCARSHDPNDVVTVLFLKEDLQRLVMFLMLGEKDLITERIFRKLSRYYKVY